MTEEELSEIELRASRATKGPWVRLPVKSKYYYTRVLIGVGELHVVGIAPEGHVPVPSHDEISMLGEGDEIDCMDHVQTQNDWDNAEFIARSRDDVPALIAEIKRLRSLINND